MTRIAARVIYRRLARCGTNTCLKLLTGVGGVLSFYVVAIYSIPGIFRLPDLLVSAAVIVLSAGLYYVCHRRESHHRYAEMLLRRIYGERPWSLAATLIAETLILTGAAVVAGLVLMDITSYYFKIPAQGWKIHLPGLLVKSALMGMASGAAVAWHSCRQSITSLLEKLRDHNGLPSRDRGARS